MMHVVLLLDAKLGDLWLRRQSIVDFAASLRQMSATIDRRRVQVRTFFLKLSALGNVDVRVPGRQLAGHLPSQKTSGEPNCPTTRRSRTDQGWSTYSGQEMRKSALAHSRLFRWYRSENHKSLRPRPRDFFSVPAHFCSPFSFVVSIRFCYNGLRRRIGYRLYTSDLAQRTPMPLPPCDGCSALTVAARVRWWAILVLVKRPLTVMTKTVISLTTSSLLRISFSVAGPCLWNSLPVTDC